MAEGNGDHAVGGQIRQHLAGLIRHALRKARFEIGQGNQIAPLSLRRTIRSSMIGRSAGRVRTYARLPNPPVHRGSSACRRRQEIVALRVRRLSVWLSPC